MTISLTARLDEQVRLISATSLGSDWTTATYVSMKNYKRLTIVADMLGSGGAVGGGAVTLLQAKTVAAGSAKALAFTRALYAVDLLATQLEASVALTELAVTSNTFTIPTTASKRVRYVLEIDSDSLDIESGFDCVRFVSTALTGGTGHVNYILWGARYSAASCMID
jgi:hypothetical protein